MSGRHVVVPKRERRDPGRVLYWLLRDDLRDIYTVRMPDDPVSYVRLGMGVFGERAARLLVSDLIARPASQRR